MYQAMTERDKSYLSDGGEEMGMTNEQYKGMLLDQLEVWEEVIELAKEANDTKVIKKAEQQVAKIKNKLEF